MFYPIRFYLFFVLCLFPASTTFAGIDIAKKMEDATMFVVTEDADSYGFGSGFIVAKGLIMTNAHVLEGYDTIYVTNQKLEITEAKIVALDDTGSNDFALLRFEQPKNLILPALSFNTNVARTNKVTAWGFPILITQYDDDFNELIDGDGLTPPQVVCTEGIVNTIIRKELSTIIHSAAISGGNSGGPLVNEKGEVVGINTWVATEKDEGAFVNAALTSVDIIKFLRKAGLNPLIIGENSTIKDNTKTTFYTPSIKEGIIPPTVAGSVPNSETNSTSSTVISGLTSALGDNSTQRKEIILEGDDKWQFQ